MFVFTISDIIQLTLLAIFLVVAAVRFTYMFIREYYEDFARWKCVKHNYKLSRTNSFGQKHWYKCDKCGKEKLR